MLEYADTLLRAGEFERALQAADEMTLDAHRAMIRARVAQQRGQPEQALAHFDEAFRLWPDNPWARYYAALAAEAIGDFDRAIEEYRYAIRISPAATDARTRVARLHLAEGRAAEGLELLRVKRREAPLDFEGEVLMLRLQARLGQVDPALSHLARITIGSPCVQRRRVTSAAEGLSDYRGPVAALSLLRSAQSRAWISRSRAMRRRCGRWFASLTSLVSREGSRDRRSGCTRAHPEVAVLREIQGLDLELRGAPEEAIRTAYERRSGSSLAARKRWQVWARLALERSPTRRWRCSIARPRPIRARGEAKREAAAISLRVGACARLRSAWTLCCGQSRPMPSQRLGWSCCDSRATSPTTARSSWPRGRCASAIAPRGSICSAGSTSSETTRRQHARRPPTRRGCASTARPQQTHVPLLLPRRGQIRRLEAGELPTETSSHNSGKIFSFTITQQDLNPRILCQIDSGSPLAEDWASVGD